MNTLIIAEKPSVALRVALALGENKPRRGSFGGVGYYELEREGANLYVVAAAGHLFSLRQKGEKKELPIFDIEWEAAYKVRKEAYFTKKYLDTIDEVGKRCSVFINACDYDLEGTVIGSNIIKYVVNKDVDSEIKNESVKRMRFSTTTTPDLIEAYRNLAPFDFENLYAGETRHMLDWMWGINMSRALMRAVSSAGIKRVLSVGRVQGPTLSVVAKREKEIRSFVAEPFWKIIVLFKGVEFDNSRGSILKKEIAEQALRATKEGEAIVKETSSMEEMMGPYPPFDLTSLQLEASRVHRIDPSRTLAIAQTLYERAYISYPRTSSQKLPPTLNLRRIISDIAKNGRYAELAQRLISGSRYRPREGAKQDEAHPAIYPTGELPKKLEGEEEKVYDLIVKRFLACFAEYAKVEKRRISLEIGGESYSTSGDKVKERGWMDFYQPYYKHRELELPDIDNGETITIEKAEMREGMTEPPRRYTKATLIALLEKKNLGTKATRSAIIDTLFKREYIRNSKIEVTDFGMRVYESLSRYCGEILDEDLTKKLELDMEGIAKGSVKKEDVIKEGREIISRIVGEFEKNKKEIGNELNQGIEADAEANVLGKCNSCGGNIVIKRSRKGKVFAGCSNWPNCSVSYPLPQYAKIIPLRKVCELCHTPMVKVFSKGKVFQMDLDPNCESKKNWGKKKDEASTTGGDAQKSATTGAKAADKKRGDGEGHAKRPRKATKRKAGGNVKKRGASQGGAE